MIYRDNTMLSCIKMCERKFYLRHIRHWRSEGISLPLIFGSAWHAGMNAIWTLASSQPDEVLVAAAMHGFEKIWDEGLPEEVRGDKEFLGKRNLMTASLMFEGYVAARGDWIREHVTDIESEIPFTLNFIVGKEEEETIKYIGRIDKVCKIDGKYTLIEHKTSSDYRTAGGFSHDFLTQWWQDAQIDGYLKYGMEQSLSQHASIWIDGALVHTKEHNKFVFIPIEKQITDLAEWHLSTKRAIEKSFPRTAIEKSPSKTGGYMSYPKNTEACFGRYGVCQYYSLCCSGKNIDQQTEAPLGFIEEPWEPFDLLGLEKIGLTKED